MIKTTLSPWPGQPYKGLNYYDQHDVPIFAGRNSDVRDAAILLAHPATRTMLLHGRTGCGKSSFLRAGLIPHITEHAFDFSFLRDDAQGHRAIFIRCGNRPLEGLAAHLYRFAAEPYVQPTRFGNRRIELLSAFEQCANVVDVRRRAQSVDYLLKVILELSRRLPVTLVLVLDQAEEVLTLNPAADDKPYRDAFFDFLREFTATSSTMKLIVALRSERVVDFFDQLKINFSLRADIILFDLRGLEEDEIIEAIKRPTLEIAVDSYGVPFDVYGFKFQPRLPERIAREVLGKSLPGGALPVVQIVCQNLYHEVVQTEGRGEITEDDFTTLGGVEGQIDAYLTRALHQTFQDLGLPKQHWKREEARWRNILAALARTQPDGQVVTDVVAKEQLSIEARKAGVLVRKPEEALERLGRPDLRVLRAADLVRQEDQATVPCFSLGHDAIGLALDRWRASSKERAEAERQRRMRIFARIGAYSSAALGIAATIGTFFAVTFKNEAETARNTAVRLISSAETKLDTDYDLSLLLAVEAATIEEGQPAIAQGGQPLAARAFLIDLLARSPDYIVPTVGYHVWAAAGRKLVLCCREDAYAILDLATGALEPHPLPGNRSLSNRPLGLQSDDTGENLFVLTRDTLEYFHPTEGFVVDLVPLKDEFARRYALELEAVSSHLGADGALLLAAEQELLGEGARAPVYSLYERETDRTEATVYVRRAELDLRTTYGTFAGTTAIAPDGRRILSAQVTTDSLKLTLWEVDRNQDRQRFYPMWSQSIQLSEDDPGASATNQVYATPAIYADVQFNTIIVYVEASRLALVLAHFRQRSQTEPGARSIVPPEVVILIEQLRNRPAVRPVGAALRELLRSPTVELGGGGLVGSVEYPAIRIGDLSGNIKHELMGAILHGPVSLWLDNHYVVMTNLAASGPKRQVGPARMDVLDTTTLVRAWLQLTQTMRFPLRGRPEVRIWDVTEPRGYREAELYRAPLSELIELACGLAGRAIRADEWREFFGEEPYRNICGRPEFGAQEAR